MLIKYVEVRNMARTDLSNEQWAKLEPLLPPEHSGKKGHPYQSHRTVINGILWRLRTGAPWRDLPARYGPFQTCFDRLDRWQKSGVWTTVLQQLQASGEADGHLDWSSGCADGSIIRAHQCAAGAAHKSVPVPLGPPAPQGLEPDPPPVDYTAAQALGYSKGGYGTKIHLVVEAQGQPLAATLSPGQAHESQYLASTLDAVRVPRVGKGGPRKRPG